jgi:hypothetical protein
MRLRIHFGVLVLAIGCAGGQGDPASSDPVTSGDEIPVSTLPPSPLAPIPEEPEGPPPPIPTGPGHLLVEVRLGSDAHPGRVRVLNGDGAEVAQARDGDDLELPPGAYTLAGTVTDPELLVDTPERTSDPVELAPAGTATARLTFARARVRVVVTSRGRPLPSAVVKFHRARSEEVVAEHAADGRFLPISPGRYDLYVTDRGHTVRANDIALQNGASQTIPVTFD